MEKGRKHSLLYNLFLILFYASVNLAVVDYFGDYFTKDAQYFDAKIVDTQYATTRVQDPYVVVVKEGDEDIPKNRIRIKADSFVYKTGDSIVINVDQRGHVRISSEEDRRMASTNNTE